MPWHISDSSGRYCVYKDGDSDPLHCYDTKDEAVQYMRALYASEGDKAIDLTDETAVTWGGEVKALPGGKVGGYLIRFTREGDTDLTGDFFTKDTDLGEPVRLPVIYHHGLDETLKRRRIGTADTKVDDIGLWIEAQLSMRDEYEKKIYEMAQAGKLGWSSGAAAHVVEKEPTGKGNHITQWYIAEASLTPAPAEPRNSVIPLKSLLSVTPAEKPTEGGAQATGEVATRREGGKDAELPIKEHKAMTDETKVESGITPDMLQKVARDAAAEAVKAYAASAPAPDTAGVQVVKDEADRPFKSAGDFFMAVKNAAIYPSETDRRLLPLKASGLNEAIPSQGGFLVPQEIAAGIYEKMYNTGTLLSLFPPTPVSGNGMTFNVNDETSRAAGSRWGGIRGYWLAEGATKTSSKPTFRQLELKLKKVAALVYATDELLEDAAALESFLMRAVPDELRFNVEDAFINGNGVGKPLGILNSPALISVTRNDAAEVDADDILTMWSRRYAGYNDYIWLGNQQIFSQLAQLTVGNTPVFLPAGGLSGLPYNVLLGRPYYDIEYAPTLGEIGDLLLVSPSAYKVIGKASGIQTARSTELAFLTDEQIFRFVLRIDAAPLWQSSLTGYDGVTYSPFVSLTTST